MSGMKIEKAACFPQSRVSAMDWNGRRLPSLPSVDADSETGEKLPGEATNRKISA
jgi:hypothetical protein